MGEQEHTAKDHPELDDPAFLKELSSCLLRDQFRVLNRSAP